MYLCVCEKEGKIWKIRTQKCPEMCDVSTSNTLCVNLYKAVRSRGDHSQHAPTSRYLCVDLHKAVRPGGDFHNMRRPLGPYASTYNLCSPTYALQKCFPWSFPFLAQGRSTFKSYASTY